MTDQELEAKAEEVSDQIRRASPDQLIAGMYSLVRPSGLPLDEQAKRAMIRTLALRLATKVMQPGYCDE